MIGYDPNSLMIHMAHKQDVCDRLLSCNTDAERGEMATQLAEHSKAVVLEKTGIKIGCKAIICLDQGISLTEGMKPIHNHDDPDQHVTVEVTNIDCWGNIYYIDHTGKECSKHMGMITLSEK